MVVALGPVDEHFQVVEAYFLIAVWGVHLLLSVNADRLTDEEYALMKSHVEKGAQILKNFTLINHVEEGALYHHERYDGSGYMYGLKGEEIPLNARIIGIADAFDAMTANRVYRKKLDKDYVIREIKRGSGTQFDPKLVEIMLGLIEKGLIDIDNLYKDGENHVEQ